MGAPPITLRRAEALFQLLIQEGFQEIGRAAFDGLVVTTTGVGSRSAAELVKTGEAAGLWQVQGGQGRGRKQSLQLRQEAAARLHIQ